MTLHVRATILTNYRKVAELLGLQVEKMMVDAGLSSSVLSTPDAKIPVHPVIRLLEKSAEAAGVETLGLQMSEGRKLSDFGPIGLLFRNQRTLRNIFVDLIDQVRAINEPVSIDVEEYSTRVLVKIDVALSVGLQKRQAIELAVGANIRLMQEFLGSEWRPAVVCFVHSRPRDISLHQRLLGHDVRFNSDFNGFVLKVQDFQKESPIADDKLAEYARQVLKIGDSIGNEPSVLHEVRRVVAKLLPEGKCGVGMVANHMGMAKRTLQRKLLNSGSSSSNVINSVRKDLAGRYVLESRRTFTEISTLLGFSSLSGFSTWYHKQFGHSPRSARTSRYASLASQNSIHVPRKIAGSIECSGEE